MDIVINTSDPESIDPDAIKAAVEGLGYFVHAVHIEGEEEGLGAFEQRITDAVLAAHPTATRWTAGTVEYDNGYWLSSSLVVATPNGEVGFDSDQFEDDLTAITERVGPLGRHDEHEVEIKQSGGDRG